MRNFIAILTLAALCLGFTGCAGMHASPVIPAPSFIYAQYTAPMDTDAENTDFGSKVGEAQAMSILGAVTMGDCSVRKAAENGGITTVKHVDYKVTNILGIYATYTTIAYGD